MDNLIGQTYKIQHFNVEKMAVELVDVILESIIDGPEHDPRDYAIITHPIQGEMDLPLTNFINAVEKAMEVA